MFDGIALDFPRTGVTTADPAEIAARLRRIADEIAAGAATDALLAHLVTVALGIDTDGTPDVNLDSGERTLILRYRRA